MARGIRRFDGRSAFSTWSYRVATNASLDELRRRRRRPVPDAVGQPGGVDARGGSTSGDHDLDRVDPLDRAGGPTLVGGGSGAEGPTGDGGIEAVAERLAVDAGLDHLAPEYRAAVVLRDLCDLDYAEIARILEVPPGTVRSRIARGRARLADVLGNPAPTPGRPSPRP